MAILDATTVAEKWANRAGAAGADYQRGVENTTIDPTAAAVANGQGYINGVQQAYASGKWARALQRVGKQGWLNATLSKGVQNYTTGVMQAKDKYAAAIAPVLAFEAGLQRTVHAMDASTPAGRKARMNAWFDGMSAYGQNR